MSEFNSEEVMLMQMINDWFDHRITRAETHTPTSELLYTSASLIHDLMIGRGVDRHNGFRWEILVSELRERGDAFKAIEDEGRK